MLKRFLRWGLLLGALAWCQPGQSAPANAPAPSSSASPEAMPPIGKDNPVHVFADTVRYEALHKLMHLDGHVHFDMKDTTLTTEHAEFNTETQLGKLTGGVKISQPGSAVTADHMLIFYARRRAVLSGGVHLLTTQSAKPSAQASGTPTPPTTLDCDELEYYWEQQLGNAVGHVRVEQGDKKSTSDVAHYNGATQLVTMLGHVQFSQGGNTVQAPEAYLNMKDQTFVAQSVTATLYLSDDKKPSATPTAHVHSPATRVLVPPLAPQLQPVVPQDAPPDMQGIPAPAVSPTP